VAGADVSRSDGYLPKPPFGASALKERDVPLVANRYASADDWSA